MNVGDLVRRLFAGPNWPSTGVIVSANPRPTGGPCRLIIFWPGKGFISCAQNHFLEVISESR